MLALCLTAAAQDTVVVQGRDGKTKVTRQGEILDFTGAELRLKTTAGREEPIPRQRVLEFKTQWTEAHTRGDELRQAGKLEEAIAAYQQALKEERRGWARRQVAASLVACRAESGRFDLAGNEFLAIVADDPTTQHFDVAPIAWRPFPPDAALESRAEAWLNASSRMPAAGLLGASWLLSTGQRAAAIKVLEEISAKRGPGDNAQLADVQLWRTKIVTAKESDVARWQSAVERMPREIQAVGWYVVGDGLARVGKAEDAALAYLRVPISYGKQRVMSADALLAAGKQLESLGRIDQAAGLYREVVSDYGATPAAGEAQTRLLALAKSK